MGAPKSWSKLAELLIQTYGNKMTDKELAELLKKETGVEHSWETVKKKRQRLKVFKTQGTALYKRDDDNNAAKE